MAGNGWTSSDLAKPKRDVTTDQEPSQPGASAAARGYLFVLLAAALWATLGVIYKYLAGSYGLPPLAVAAFRAGLGGLLLLTGLVALRRSWLRLNRQGVQVVVLYGIFGIALFYATYINAILSVGVAVAAVLLYTAPAWVALIAWRFLGEQLTRVHVLALLLALSGTALVAQIYQPDTLRLNALGIVWGLLAGLTYALWSVFNKIGIRHTNPWTLQCYGMLVGSAVLLLVQPLEPITGAHQSPGALVWLFVLAIGPTVGASVAYAAGVRTVPVSVASLVATLEPVLAAILAFLILGETLAAGQVAGGALILLAVWLLRPKTGG